MIGYEEASESMRAKDLPRQTFPNPQSSNPNIPNSQAQNVITNLNSKRRDPNTLNQASNQSG
jgi:hypothetical protein